VRLPTRGPVPPLEAVVARAGGAPEVDAARAMRRAAAAERELARRMYLPMVALEAMYEQRLDGARDSWGGGVMLSIPLWWRGRQRSEVAMADAMIIQAEREERAMRQMASAELRMAWSTLRGADRRLDALEQRALPSLRASLDSTRASYVAGRADLLVLLEELTALREVEMQRLGAVVVRERAQQELDRIAGGGA
jgi:outer membrane protein TolC